MDNQAQNRHPEDQLPGNPGANKRNTKKNSSDQGSNPLEGNSHWPDESLSADGLVDREIGDGSEDLDDIETDGDDELSTK